MQAYVKAKSKADLNMRLANDETIYVTVYGVEGTDRLNIRQLDDGAVLKIYDKFAGGNPVAKSYGKWKAAKRKVV